MKAVLGFLCLDHDLNAVVAFHLEKNGYSQACNKANKPLHVLMLSFFLVSCLKIKICLFACKNKLTTLYNKVN